MSGTTTDRLVGWVGRVIGVWAVTIGLALCFPWLLLAMAGLWVVALAEGRRHPGGWRATAWGRFPAWYFGPETAVIRSVAWMSILVAPAMLMVFVLPLLQEAVAADPELQMEPELVTVTLVGVLVCYVFLAMAVVAHACWQSYRAERRILGAAVDAEVARLHQLYVDRDITRVHYAVTCQNCGRADLRLFLGQSETCGCGSLLNRSQAVRLAS